MRQLILIVLIFLITILVRGYRLPETFIFAEDQEDLSWRVKQIVIDHQLTLLGAKFSTLGFYLPPGYLYFLVPFFWLTNFHPATGQLVILVLTGITGILLYLAGGWLAWWLYLTSPLLHQYDRIFWNPNLILPASALVTLALIQKRPLLVAFGLSLALQSHPQVFGLVLLTLLYLFMRRQSFHLTLHRWLIFFLTLFLSVSPLVLFELRHQFLLTRYLLQNSSQLTFRPYYLLFLAPPLILIISRTVTKFWWLVLAFTAFSFSRSLLSTTPSPDALPHKLAAVTTAIDLINSGQASPNIQINGSAEGFHYLIWYVARQKNFTVPIAFHESWDNPPPKTAIINANFQVSLKP